MVRATIFLLFSEGKLSRDGSGKGAVGMVHGGVEGGKLQMESIV